LHVVFRYRYHAGMHGAFQPSVGQHMSVQQSYRSATISRGQGAVISNIPIEQHVSVHQSKMLCPLTEAKGLVLHEEKAEEGVDQALAILVDVELGRGSTSDGADTPDTHERAAEGEAEDKPAVLDVAHLVHGVDIERAPGVLAVVEGGVPVDEADDEKSVVPGILELDGERLVVGNGVGIGSDEGARLRRRMATTSVMKRGEGLDELDEPVIDRVRRGIGRPSEPLAISKETVFTMAALAIDLSSSSLEIRAATTELLSVEIGDVIEDGIRLDLKNLLGVRVIIKLHGVVRIVSRRRRRANAAVVASVDLARGAHESKGRVPDLEIVRLLHVDEDEDDVLKLVDIDLPLVNAELEGQEVAAESGVTSAGLQDTRAAMVLKATEDQEDEGPSFWRVVRNGGTLTVCGGNKGEREMMVIVMMAIGMRRIAMTESR
jgi:hypothetical protein